MLQAHGGMKQDVKNTGRNAGLCAKENQLGKILRQALKYFGLQISRSYMI